MLSPASTGMIDARLLAYTSAASMIDSDESRATFNVESALMIKKKARVVRRHEDALEAGHESTANGGVDYQHRTDSRQDWVCWVAGGFFRFLLRNCRRPRSNSEGIAA